MKLELLRIAARRPLLTVALGLAASAGLAAGAASLLLGDREAPSADVATEHEADDDVGPAEKNPRLLLGRLWLDRMPRKPTDDVDLWIFFGGGIGLHETGSRWKGSYELFDLERRGSKLDVQYLQSKKKVTTRFTITACDDLPPFDLCLVLEDMPGGAVRLHGFDYDDDMDRAMPWARATREAARTKTAAPRD